MGMRVIAGSAKGRRLKSPAIGTRPMTDAMKESLFARPADERMDLIFVDPPYNMAVPQVRADLESIVMGGWLADEGRVVVHRPHKEAQLKPFGLATEAEKHYGQSRILIFRHEDE